MAALPEAPLPQLVELPQVSVKEFDTLLKDEIEVWQRRFAWDFRPSADLLRRFLQIQSLYGYALRIRRELVGYAYHVCEGHKGLIGDFYLREEYATASNEAMLLGAVVKGLMAAPGIRRIESQLMLLRSTLPQVPFARHATRHDRYFMTIARDAITHLPPASPRLHVRFAPWTERAQEETAHLVAASYRGHVDSEINDQYRTIPGARHFLMNIINFPGCGHFSAPASVIAIDEKSGRLCGICLASFISADSGHVTQLCILPALRGERLGYELLRQSLLRLVELGCTSMSLTVTCSNIDATRLYESMGFRSRYTFPAMVWDSF